jgi:hypothetical protein
MLRTIRNALPRVRLVSLVRSCYVLLLSCYLGNVLVVQPFLPPNQQKNIYKNVVCFAHEKTPQTTMSLASVTSLKKIHAYVGIFWPLIVLPLKLNLHSL